MKLQFFIPLIGAAAAHVGLWLVFSQLFSLPPLLQTEPVRVRVVDAPVPAEAVNTARAAQQGSAPSPHPFTKTLPAVPKSAAQRDSSPLNAQLPSPLPQLEDEKEQLSGGQLESRPESSQLRPTALPNTDNAPALGNATPGVGNATPGVGNATNRGSPNENSNLPRNPCGTLRVPSELLGQGLFPRRYLAHFKNVAGVDESNAKWTFSGFVAAPGTPVKSYLDALLRRIFEKCIPALNTSVLPASVQTVGEEFSFPVEFVE